MSERFVTRADEPAQTLEMSKSRTEPSAKETSAPRMILRPPVTVAPDSTVSVPLERTEMFDATAPPRSVRAPRMVEVPTALFRTTEESCATTSLRMTLEKLTSPERIVMVPFVETAAAASSAEANAS